MSSSRRMSPGKGEKGAPIRIGRKKKFLERGGICVGSNSPGHGYQRSKKTKQEEKTDLRNKKMKKHPWVAPTKKIKRQAQPPGADHWGKASAMTPVGLYENLTVLKKETLGKNGCKKDRRHRLTIPGKPNGFVGDGKNRTAVKGRAGWVIKKRKTSRLGEVLAKQRGVRDHQEVIEAREGNWTPASSSLREKGKKGGGQRENRVNYRSKNLKNQKKKRE